MTSVAEEDGRGVRLSVDFLNFSLRKTVFVSLLNETFKGEKIFSCDQEQSSQVWSPHPKNSSRIAESKKEYLLFYCRWGDYLFSRTKFC